jgi:glycosyltransferase involved in cell wall biosynthesis
MRLSVIIPVYNVEAYIEKCVQSLRQQDIDKSQYEIIIINDGSPDNSRDVVIRLMRQHDNIVFIDQENKGVSLARNAGIDKAKGKYLLFIDPDDYIEQNSIARVLAAADQQQAQIAFLGFSFLDENGVVKKEILLSEEKEKLYPGIRAYHISRGDGKTDPDRSVAILFERTFINEHHLRNLADVPYLEDGEFIARALCLAERCIFEGGPFYLRTTRKGSATNSRLFYSDKSVKGFIKAAKNLFNFQQNAPLTGAQKIFLNQPVCKFVLLAANASLKNEEKLGLKDVVNDFKKMGLNKCELHGCKKVYRREGFFYNLSPHAYAVYKPVWSLIESVFFRLFSVRL